MAKCQECRLGRLGADGACRYCVRAKERVGPSRAVALDGVLRTFVVASVATTVVVFGARAVLYVLSYQAVGDLSNGDFAALDSIHTYSRWMTIDWWATIAGLVALGRVRQRWMDAGNAHALTRPDIGLGWFRGMPSSRANMVWELAGSFGYVAIVVLNLVFRHAATDPEQLRTWAVLEVTLCAAVIAASIAAATTARQMTAQLQLRIAASEQAEQAEQAERAEQAQQAEPVERAEQAEQLDRSAEPDPVG